MRNIHRGDIYYIANAKCFATDPSNPEGRPGIVVSSDHINRNSDYVEIVYLTTRPRSDIATHVPVICKVQSTAMCEGIYTVNTDRIGDFIRTCTDAEMEQIEDGLLASLGISAPIEDVEDEPDYKKASGPIFTYSPEAEQERNLYKKLYNELLDKVISKVRGSIL